MMDLGEVHGYGFDQSSCQRGAGFKPGANNTKPTKVG